MDFFALQNVVEANYPINPSESVAIADIGAQRTKFVVIATTASRSSQRTPRSADAI